MIATSAPRASAAFTVSNATADGSPPCLPAITSQPAALAPGLELLDRRGAKRVGRAEQHLASGRDVARGELADRGGLARAVHAQHEHDVRLRREREPVVPTRRGAASPRSRRAGSRAPPTASRPRPSRRTRSSSPLAVFTPRSACRSCSSSCSSSASSTLPPSSLPEPADERVARAAQAVAQLRGAARAPARRDSARGARNRATGAARRAPGSPCGSRGAHGAAAAPRDSAERPRDAQPTAPPPRPRAGSRRARRGSRSRRRRPSGAEHTTDARPDSRARAISASRPRRSSTRPGAPSSRRRARRRPRSCACCA